jgi:Berberine and berberine like
VDVYGAVWQGGSRAEELVDELILRAGSDPTVSSAEESSFAETQRFWAELGAEEAGQDDRADVPPAGTPYLFAKSEFFRRPLSPEAIAALVGIVSRGRSPGESRELDFMPWGGTYNRRRHDATAFVHRDELFQLKHAVVVDPLASTSAKEAAHRWVTRSWRSVHPEGSARVFQNLPDPELEDWAEAYYGTNTRRLVEVKATYDPSNVFRFHQSLPTRLAVR